MRRVALGVDQIVFRFPAKFSAALDDTTVMVFLRRFRDSVVSAQAVHIPHALVTVAALDHHHDEAPGAQSLGSDRGSAVEASGRSRVGAAAVWVRGSAAWRLPDVRRCVPW